MKTALATLILVFAVPTTYADFSIQHPIHGQWTWTFERNSCTEVYHYKSDNTARVTSGAEIAESRFTLSEKPDQNGFYRMTDVVTKSNGQTGCDGTAGGTPVGHEVTNYLILNATREKLLICWDASLNQCFGPLQRIGK
ncbi:hypothetical protein [Herbaspirillum chlorophenolicum]|uniref:hypothetical protein n=1 Tax=Herbaspirillum chlorophenolicum TaxID=211589 RepID=UPI0012E16668|nr:hypothetical protein [Herbaspirillum chlorophenolicum]